MSVFGFGRSSPSGHRILVVLPDSPAAQTGLVPILDLITAVEGVPTDDGEHSLPAVLGRRIGEECELTVYNSKTGSHRKAMLVR